MKGKKLGRNRISTLSPRRRLEKVVERPLEVGEGHALVHEQALHLIEHRQMGGVDRLPAVDLAGHDDPDGRPALLHDPDLHGRGMRPEEQFLAEIERVPVIPGGVMGREVEGLEIVVLGFDLRPLGHGKPHGPEDALDLLFEDRQGVERPPGDNVPRQGRVERRRAVCRGLRRLRGRRQGGKLLLNIDLELVQELPRPRLFGRGQAFELFEEQGDDVPVCGSGNRCGGPRAPAVLDPGQGLVELLPELAIRLSKFFISSRRRV